MDASTSLSGNFSGLIFNFTYGVGIPLNRSNAITAVAQQSAAEWSSFLKDNIALNLQLEFVDLPSPIIGGSRPAMVKVNYKDFVTALFDDKTSQRDWTVLNNLQLDAKDRDVLVQYGSGSLDSSKVKFGTKQFDMLLDNRFNQSGSSQSGSFLDRDGDANNQKIWLTRANAKALNLLKSGDQKLDAIIQMNRSVAWDFNPRDGVTPGTYDFSTVLKHEIGHALGVVSGVDAFEFLTLTQAGGLTDKDLTYVSPMDLFRYSSESAQSGVIDMRMGGGITKYFSVDRGQTNLGEFSTGGTNVGGDGFQSSHWKESAQPLGIMRPQLQTGQSLNISGLDLQLLDAIGWNLQSPIGAKASATGMNWNQVSQQLADRQRNTVSTLASSWASKNPGYSIQPDLEYETYRLNFQLNRSIEAEIDSLSRKAASIGDANKRSQEIQNTVNKIWELQRKQAEELADFVKERERLDERVRNWLNLDADKLAEELQTAIGVEFVRLSDVVRNAPFFQRIGWEIKLRESFTYLTDNPGKAVEELLKTTGPGNDLLRWGRRQFWTLFQTAEDASLDLLYELGWRRRQFWTWFQMGEDANLNVSSSEINFTSSPPFLNKRQSDPLTGLG